MLFKNVKTGCIWDIIEESEIKAIRNNVDFEVVRSDNVEINENENNNQNQENINTQVVKNDLVFEEMSVIELKKYAKENNIDLKLASKKDDIIAVLKEVKALDDTTKA